MYRVEWEPSASDQFAAICMDHLDRWQDINVADNDLGKQLQRDPFAHGKPLSEGLWRIVSNPLVVYFSVEGHQVVVEAVGWIE